MKTSKHFVIEKRKNKLKYVNIYIYMLTLGRETKGLVPVCS